MSRDLFFLGVSIERVDQALASLRNGGGVVVVDDDDRENEGDLIYPAETLTERQMAMLIRHCSGWLFQLPLCCSAHPLSGGLLVCGACTELRDQGYGCLLSW